MAHFIRTFIIAVVASFAWTALLPFAGPVAYCAPPPPFTIMMEEYPPLSYEKDGKKRGIALEAVQYILAAQGYDTTLKFYPWPRAYHMLKTGTKHALFPLVRTADREHLFKWVGPLFSETEHFFKRKGNPLTIKTIDDAKSVKRISVTDEDYYESLLKGMGFKNLDAGKSHEVALIKLKEGRVDLSPGGSKTLEYFISNTPSLSMADYEITDYILDHSSIWIGFTPDTPDSVISAWQKILKEYRASGKEAEVIRQNLSGQ